MSGTISLAEYERSMSQIKIQCIQSIADIRADSEVRVARAEAAEKYVFPTQCMCV